MTHLRQFLEEHGVLYPEQMEEARRRQQIYGGSLDTVLLELRLVDPETLNDMLERACGFPIVPADLLGNGIERPWSEIPEDMQQSRWVEPLVRDGKEIVVAVHPDLPNEQLGKLLRSVGRLRPMVTPECCLEKVAAEKHQSVVPQRYAVLWGAYINTIKKRPSVTGMFSGVGEGGRPLLEPAPDPEPDPVIRSQRPTRELVGVPGRATIDDTQPIQALSPVSGSIDVDDPAPVGLPDESYPLPRRALAETMIDTRGPSAGVMTPDPDPANPADEAPPPAAETSDSEKASDSSDASGSEPPAPAQPLVRDPADLRRRLDHALTELDTERSRDTALRAVVDAALVLSSRVGLFRVRGEELVGLSSPRSALPDLGGKTLTATADSAANSALSEGRYHGLATDTDLRLATGTEGSTPCVLQRIAVRGRPIVVVYLDRDGDPIDDIDLEALGDISRVASGVFEEILKLRRLAAPNRPTAVATEAPAAPSTPATDAPKDGDHQSWATPSAQIQAAYGGSPSGEPAPVEPTSSSRTSTPDREHPDSAPPPALVPPVREPSAPRPWQVTPGAATEAVERPTPGHQTALLGSSGDTQDADADAEPSPETESIPPTRPTMELSKLGQTDPEASADAEPDAEAKPPSRPTQGLGSGPPPEPGTETEELNTRATMMVSPPPPPIPPPPPSAVDEPDESEGGASESGTRSRRVRSSTIHGLPPPDAGPGDSSTTMLVDEDAQLPNDDDDRLDGDEPQLTDQGPSHPAQGPVPSPAAAKPEPATAPKPEPAANDDEPSDDEPAANAAETASEDEDAPAAEDAPEAEGTPTAETAPADDDAPADEEPTASESEDPPEPKPELDQDEVVIISLAQPIMPATARGRIELEDEDWVAPPVRRAPPTHDDQAIDDIITAVLAGDATVERLRDLGEPAFQRLVRRFPGPLEVLRRDLRSLPPPSAHGPVIRTVIAVGSGIVPYLLDLFEHDSHDLRFYASFVFHELRDPRCMRPMAPLAFDSNGDVRIVSMRVLETYRRSQGFRSATSVVREQLSAESRTHQLYAARAAGTLRDVGGIPELIALLSSSDRFIQEASLESLCSITGQQHGLKPHRWRNWYQEHGTRHRVQWIIDSLRHRDLPVRRWAADELVRITGHRVPFSPMGDRRSRDVAAKAWTVWWDETGRRLFGDA